MYSVTKGIYYQQASTDSPVVLTNNGYIFEADVFLTTPGGVRSAFVQAPGSTNQALALADPDQFQLKDKYNTKAKLDSHYPDGNFVITVNTVHDGNGFISLALQGNSYPTSPRVSNFPATQWVNPAGYFALSWDPMAGGNANDFIQFHIEDSNGDKVFETPDFGEDGALNGTATFAFVKPGTLNANKIYQATLRFQRNVTLNNSSYPGALGVASYFTRTSFALLTTGGSQPDVDSYELTKSQSFVQVDSGPAAPEPDKEYNFEAKVNGAGANLIAASSLLTPSGNTFRLTTDSDKEDFDYADTNSSPGLLDSAYFPGTYTFSITTIHDGTRSVPLNLPSTYYPPAPHLINFDATQNLRVNQGFRFQWDAWPQGTDSDFVQLRIEDNDNNKVFETPDITESGALDGHANSALVPSGTLIPGKSYRGRIYFHKVLQLDDTSYPGVLGVASFYSKTKFNFDTAAPDVKTFSIAKGHEFIQMDNGAPTANVSTAFVFTASVVASDAGTVNGASVITPRGISRPLTLQADGRTFSLRDGCDDQSQVDAAYPDGSYTLQINTVHEGTRNVALALAGSSYPNAPHLANFPQMQLVEPGATFSLQWEPFTGGDTNDFISVEFDGVFGNAIFLTKPYGKSAALNGTTTSLDLPNGTFESGKLYRGSLLFEKILTATQSSYPGAQGLAGYFSRTGFSLATIGPGNPSSLSSMQISTNGQLTFMLEGLIGATYRIDCSANLVQWTPFATNSATAMQTLVSDPDFAKRPCFFYRAVLLP